METGIARWTERLEGAIARERLAHVRRVMVVAEAGSTQDVARAHAGGGGLLVVAGRQSNGRGRLGRRWFQQPDAGLAMTLAIGAAGREAAPVSLAAGVAAAAAVESFLPHGPPMGLRWPNDVVEREAGRKVAGVLVEAVDGLLLIGIGVNVREGPGWPEELRGRAASIGGLGGRAERIDVAERLMVELDRAVSEAAEPVRRRWLARDVLRGTRAAFVHDGRTFEGLVESIDPTHEIVLAREGGEVVRLPALTTSLLHDSRGGPPEGRTTQVSGGPTPPPTT